MKKFLTGLSVVLLIFVVALAVFVTYMTVNEYNPEDVETLEITGTEGQPISAGQDITMMTWNIGYGALGDNADFFMDGGKMVYTADRERVLENLTDIGDSIEDFDPDILLLQELDRNSARSYYNDELQFLIDNSGARALDAQTVYAPNFIVSFVPFPIPPIGKVSGGIVTASDYKIDSAERIKLPCPFSWPFRAFNLKRCLEVMRFPVKNSDKEFVLINLHLEAYDEGEGKIAQTNMLKELLEQELDKGNYVIAGGDFNQSFSNIDISMYPVHENMWEAGYIDEKDFDGYSLFTDNSAPTCRSLDSVLSDAEDKSPQGFQYYMLDGYIVSSNIDVTGCKTLDLGFKSSDHNPVVLTFSLK